MSLTSKKHTVNQPSPSPSLVQPQVRSFAPSQDVFNSLPQSENGLQRETEISEQPTLLQKLSSATSAPEAPNKKNIQRKWSAIKQRYQASDNFEGDRSIEISQQPINPVQRKINSHFSSIRAQRNSSVPIQAKLSIGEPDDKYEKEADSTAVKVVQQINAPIQAQSVQRDEAMETEDEELQMKPAISTIQRHEAMETEDEELQMKSAISTIQRDEAIEEEDEELQMKSVNSTIQRHEAMETEDEELQMKSLLQRRKDVVKGEAPTDLESSIQSMRGSGQSLDTNLQAKMGQAMGADFSGVKIHTDSQSDQLNKSIQAKAFTTGQDLFFRQGTYEPSSRSGQELIAHELTHVVQQNGSAVQAKSVINRSLIQPNRERSNAITEAPVLNLPVAKLHMHADLDAPGMPLLQQLKEGEVGHAWVALEWKDPTSVPDDLPDAHKNQLKTGADPFGFWPKKFEWKDYGGLDETEIFNRLIVDNKDAYDEMYDDLEAEYPDATPQEIIDHLRDNVIKADVDMALTWGGIQLRAADAVGYSPNPLKSYVAGQVLHPDYMHNAKATQSYDLTREEVDSVIQYAESKKSAQYSVFFYNCTTFAKEAVQAAGKPAPSAGIGGVCYPDKLYKSIKSNFEKGKGETALEVGDIMVQKIGPELTSGKKKKKK